MRFWNEHRERWRTRWLVDWNQRLERFERRRLSGCHLRWRIVGFGRFPARSLHANTRPRYRLRDELRGKRVERLFVQ